MILEQLHIEGFGRLSDFEFRFHPRLNLFFGPNEAGKSTLQQAILHLLFGFFQQNRATPLEKQVWQRFKPWRQEAYGGRLIYSLADGRRFQVRRNFADEDIPTQLFDELTGEEITQRFAVRRHGNVAFMREQIGLTKDLFEATCFVRQAQVKQISGQGHLLNDVISILDSGSAGKSAQLAIEKLKAQIGEIGTERSQKKPLNLARQRLRELEEELSGYLRARQELAEAVQQRNELKQRIEAGNRKRIELNYLILTKQISDMESRLTRVKEAQRELKQVQQELEKLQQAERFSDEKRDELLRRWQSRLNLLEQIREKREQEKELGDKLRQLETEMAPLAGYAEIAPLFSYEQFVRNRDDWLARDRELQEATAAVQKEELRLLQQEGIPLEVLQEIGSLTAEDIEAFSQEEKKLEHLKREEESVQQEIRTLETGTWAKHSLRWPLILTPVVLALTVLALAILLPFTPGFPISAGIFLLGAAVYSVYRAARRRLGRQAEQLQDEARRLHMEQERLHLEVKRRYQRYQVQSALQLVDRKAQFQHYQALVRDREKAAEAREKTEFQLRKYLAALNVRTIHAEVLDRIDAEFAQFSRLENLKKEQQKQLNQLQQQLHQAEKRLKVAEEDLSELFEELGYQNIDLEKGEEVVAELSEQRKQYQGLKKKQDRLEERLQSLLMNQTEADLQRQLEEFVGRREKLLVNHPEVSGKKPTKSVEVLQKEFQEVDQTVREEEQQRARLESRIDTVLRQHRPQAEIEEELAAVKEKVARLERARAALELAQETLQEVALNYHRNAVPFLNETVSQEMERITAGRYAQVRINPDNLTINLHLPEKDAPGSADMLSLGTQEQLYLLLRVALARLLSRDMEPLPFLLDDPFVHFDQQRLENVLAFTAELGRENQILLFTKDPFLVSWCRENLRAEDFALVEMGET